MSATRIRGQEVEIRIVKDGELQTTLTAIQNFEMVTRLSNKEEEYLGETSKRYDDIYDGIRFSFMLHLEGEEVFTFQRACIDRARRRTPQVQFNIVGVFFFPNGDTPRLSIPDVSFGEQPLNVGSRSDYVSLRIEGFASDYDKL